jgi:hypothetical protein
LELSTVTGPTPTTFSHVALVGDTVTITAYADAASDPAAAAPAATIFKVFILIDIA